jgi:hypothetical protein
MKNEALFKRAGALGFPLLATEKENANLTLAEMVKSGDLRLWEGFPVVLANSAEKGAFSNDMVKRYLKKPSDRSFFSSLVVVALAVYRFFSLKFSWADTLYGSLSKAGKKEFAGFLKKLKSDGELNAAGRKMSAQRLKTVFNNYFSQSQAKLNEFLSVKDDLGLEYSLSQVFSAKQKELFLKKLRREKMTKTEKEYFSRAVKKKVLALANPDLHRLSQRLLE